MHGKVIVINIVKVKCDCFAEIQIIFIHVTKLTKTIVDIARNKVTRGLQIQTMRIVAVMCIKNNSVKHLDLDVDSDTVKELETTLANNLVCVLL